MMEQEGVETSHLNMYSLKEAHELSFGEARLAAVESH